VKLGLPLFNVSPGARQLKMFCGLLPLNGRKPKFGSFAGNVASPSGPTSTAAGDVAESQCDRGFQPAVEGATPSHCSMKTLPGASG
jgi:hypothetical protein